MQDYFARLLICKAEHERTERQDQPGDSLPNDIALLLLAEEV